MTKILFVGASAQVEVEEFDQIEPCGCLQRVWPIQPLPSADNPVTKLRVRVKVDPQCKEGHELWKSRLHMADEPGDPDLDKSRPRTSATLGELTISGRLVIGRTSNVLVTQREITEVCGCEKISLTFEMVPEACVVPGEALVLVVYRRTWIGETCTIRHQLGFRKPRWLRREGSHPLSDLCHRTGRDVADVLAEYEEIANLHQQAEEQGILPSAESRRLAAEYAEEDARSCRPGW